MSRKHIQRKNPWQPTPAPDILKSRPFSNGKGPRESKLPTTSDILQTRPCHQAVRYSSAIIPPSTHFERREEFQFNEPGTVAVLLRGATPASTPFLRRVIGPIEANCELRQYPSGGSGPTRSPSGPPENSDHDIAYTKKKHTRDGREVQRDLKRGREAHIFNDNIDLSDLEQKVWAKGFYAGDFRSYHRWVYISPTQIGVRIQNGRDDVSLYVVEIKGQYRGDQLIYHLDPRTRASEDR